MGCSAADGAAEVSVEGSDEVVELDGVVVVAGMVGDGDGVVDVSVAGSVALGVLGDVLVSLLVCAYAKPTAVTIAAAATAELSVLETFTGISFSVEGLWP